MVRALLAVCLLGLAAFARGDGGDAAPAEANAQLAAGFKADAAKHVFFPTTTNDYGSMIYSLLEQQLNFIGEMSGADEQGTPLNLLTTMASWVHQAQAALFRMAPPDDSGATADGDADAEEAAASFHAQPSSPFPDPLTKLLNVTGAWSDIISAAHPDIVPQALIQSLIELPFGPQLDAAVKALPTLLDPIGLHNATSNFGFPTDYPGVPPVFNLGGAAQVATLSAAMFAYRPCLVTESFTGAAVAPQLIVVQPRGISSSIVGVALTPKLIEVQPTIIKIKPVGVNLAPTLINVVPTLIAVGPHVSVVPPDTAAGRAALAGRH